jgi:hypothetical protein
MPGLGRGIHVPAGGTHRASRMRNLARAARLADYATARRHGNGDGFRRRRFRRDEFRARFFVCGCETRATFQALCKPVIMGNNLCCDRF